jgi:hypothetical protein
VPDAHVVANGRSALLVGAVQDGAVLYVHFVADVDKIHVAAHNGLKPHGTIVAHDDVADDGGVFGKEAVLAELRGKVATGKDERHV